MTWEELIAQIKKEARVSGDTEFDSMIISLLNELNIEAAINIRPIELRSRANFVSSDEQPVPITDGLNFLLHHKIYFVHATKTYELSDSDKPTRPAPIGMNGYPKTFEIEDNTIRIAPTGEIGSGYELEMEYYKRPDLIDEEELDTTSPIRRLEPFLIRSAIRRIRLFHQDDVQVANALSPDIQSAATGFAQDEPIPNSRPDSNRG